MIAEAKLILDRSGADDFCIGHLEGVV